MTTIPSADFQNSRCVNAPIQTVWELWSNPDHLAQWWGPRGFRNIFHTHEFKDGGQWSFMMHGPDGVDYPNELRYLEIVPHSKISWEHVSHPKFQATALFEAQGDRTWIHFYMKLENPDLVEGYSKMDFQRGGFYHYAMVNPDGSKSWGKMYFKDIVRNKRLMFINMFSNENGDITAHPMAPQWPKEILSTVSFEGNDVQTTVTIEWIPINATPEEIQVFNDAHPGMNQGWTGSLDRLEEILA